MTEQIRVGNVKIGGGAPISIQSMAKTDTRDVAATVMQIKELERAGCEIIRVAVKDFEAVEAIKGIKRKVNLPLVADIHFDYRLALAAIENGADKIRLNPGNIYKEEEIREVVKSAKKRRIPIRVGANSGSLKRAPPYHKGTGQAEHPRTTRVRGRQSTPVPQGYGAGRAPVKDTASEMVKSVLDYIKILERMDFYDIIVSLKASDVLSTIEAYKLFSKKSRYPLHLGVTAAGSLSTGIVKSSIGIGALLLDGIGDTVRVSLTGDPVEEVIAAENILQALNLRRFGPEIISCPMCGRCQVDLQKIVREFEQRYTLYAIRYTPERFPKIAVMGCEVNGPGEAKEADVGIACGKGSGVIFKNGKILKRVKENNIVKELIKTIIS